MASAIRNSAPIRHRQRASTIAELAARKKGSTWGVLATKRRPSFHAGARRGHLRVPVVKLDSVPRSDDTNSIIKMRRAEYCISTGEIAPIKLKTLQTSTR
jgi:hypothetical protein